MLSALFTSVADALISYTIDKLDPAERIKFWLKQDPARIAFQKSLARTYSAFARQYPEYTSSLFDQHFLGTEALPELSKLLTRNQHPDPALLAQSWGQSINARADFAQTATKPASYFIERLEMELKAEPTLQALFDSRALESLPKLEVEIQKLAGDLQRGLDTALKAANDYQQVTIRIEGDVKGDGIIIGNNNQLAINKYYYSGNFVSLNEYYIPPDGVFQRVRVDEFIGRDWLTAKVDAFLNDPQRKSGAFLLIGDAGVGKTSFMAHLVKERRYLHIFAEQAPGQAMLQRAMQSLGSQLVTRYQIDPYKDRDTLNALSVFPDFLERILRLAASTLTEGEKIVIVCDALDEAGVFPDHFVFGLPKEIPAGVYFILSQRPVNVKLPNFEPVIEKLEAQGEGNLQDIEAYLRAVAKRPEVAGQIRSKAYSEEFFIQTLKEKSQGVWMYLHYIIKEIESGARAPLDLANLPTGLVGYYAEYWDAWRTGKRGKGEEAWDELYAPLLTTLAAAQEAISVETLIQWADVTVTPREVTRLLSESWRAFITEKETDGKKVYAPYHLSFKDFITGRVDTDKLPPAQANLVKDLAAQTVDAHKRIVSAFEKESNGEWEKLVEQDYPRLHLTAHMNGAGEYEKLRMMLTEGDEKNKWAEAREKKEETYAGYLNDLTYVWDYAEREQNYTLAIRCMLIESSIHALAAKIPPELLTELAKNGLWSYSRCLTILRQNPDSGEKAKGIAMLAPIIPPILWLETLAAAREIQYDSNKASALSALAPHLPLELKKPAFVMAKEIKDEESRANVLSALAPYLPGELKAQALAAAREIEDEFHKACVISALSPHISDELKPQALAMAREIKDEESKAHVLVVLVSRISDELKPQALAMAREIKNEESKAHVLTVLVSRIPDELKAQVLAAAREIKDEKRRAEILSALALHLPDKLKVLVLLEAFTVAQEIKDSYDKARELIALTPHLPEKYKAEALLGALVAVQEIKDEDDRADVLADLTPHLSIELKAQAFTVAQKIQDKYIRSCTLAVLMPHLPETFKNQALLESLTIASEIQVEGLSCHPLSHLAPYLPEELKAQAFNIVQEIMDEGTRSRTLSDIAPHLPDELKAQALVTVRGIMGDEFKSRALRALMPYLPDELKNQALATAQEIKSEFSKTRALCAFIPHLPDELKNQALTMAQEIKSEFSRAIALADIVPCLPEKLKAQALLSALALVRKIGDESSKLDAISALMPYLPEEIKTHALLDSLIAAREIQYERSRAKALVTLAPHLFVEFKTQAIAIAREIQDSYSKASALTALVPHLPKELKDEVIIEALTAAREIHNDVPYTRALLEKPGGLKAKAFTALAPYLPEGLKDQVLLDALALTQEIQNEGSKAKTLAALAPYLPEPLKNHMFSVALETRNVRGGAHMFDTLAPLLPESLKARALAAAYKIQDEYSRASALIALAPHLPESLTDQVLSDAMGAAQKIHERHFRIIILFKLADIMETRAEIIGLYQEVLFNSRDFTIYGFLLQDMMNSWQKKSYTGLDKVIAPFLRTTAQKNRHESMYILANLAAPLNHLAGRNIAPELYRTITDVTRWWP